MSTHAPWRRAGLDVSTGDPPLPGRLDVYRVHQGPDMNLSGEGVGWRANTQTLCISFYIESYLLSLALG